MNDIYSLIHNNNNSILNNSFDINYNIDNNIDNMEFDFSLCHGYYGCCLYRP